jgi:hypothetical protein
MTENKQASVEERQESLNAAIEGLYATFAHFELTGAVDGCPHCTGPGDDEVLRSKPRRKLEGGDLERFAFKAVTTLGSVEDFKHFLPRLLEVLAREGSVGVTECEIVLGKLDYTRWEQWPQRQRVAVKEYLSALWRVVLGEFPGVQPVDDWVCGIGRCEEDMGAYLRTWEEDQGAAAALQLAEFVVENAGRIVRKRELVNAFWNEREAQMRQLIEWLAEDRVADKLEKAFFRLSGGEGSDRVSEAVEQLGWVRKTRAGDA